jgi:hypothetical protein
VVLNSAIYKPQTVMRNYRMRTIPMTLNRLYFKGVLLPAIISIIGTTVLSIIENADYKSEWMTKGSAIGLALVVSCIHSLIVSLLALTIFLNNKIITTTGIPTFLSWFFLPMTWIIITVYKTIDHRLNYETDTEEQLVYLITLNLPFIIGLIWTFIIYKRQLKYR